MSHVSWNRQLGLALLLVTLGTGVYWLEFKHKPEKEEQEAQKKHVFTLKKRPIESITLRHQGQSLHIQCASLTPQLCQIDEPSSEWKITQPLQTVADHAQVRSLLSTLSYWQPQDTFSIAHEPTPRQTALLKDYGLDPESLLQAKTLEIVTDQDTTFFYLGSPHPLGDTHFATHFVLPRGQTPPQPFTPQSIDLVSQSFEKPWENDINYWRDKALFHESAQQIEAFEIRSSSSFKAVKENQQWHLRQGSQSVAGDPDLIFHYLQAMLSFKANQVVAESKTDLHALHLLKKATPAFQLTLHLKPTETQKTPSKIVLHLDQVEKTKKSKIFYARVSHQPFLYQLESLQVFEKPWDTLRFKKLMSYEDRNKINQIIISGGQHSKPQVFHQKDSQDLWIRQSDALTWNSTLFKKLWNQLPASSIESFLKPSPEVIRDESKGLHLQFKNQDLLKHYVFWKHKNHLYARDLLNKKQHEILSLSKAFQDTLPWDETAFQPQPTSSPSAQPL